MVLFKISLIVAPVPLPDALAMPLTEALVQLYVVLAVALLAE